MKKITVLLADDNQPVLGDIREMLERENNLEVVGEAGNGRQAVAMVKKLRPALVLMDVAMPLLNGLQATRQILKAVPATKVLMLSVHDHKPNRKKKNPRRQLEPPLAGVGRTIIRKIKTPRR
jgi:DNA-binding NarL/FixJ family response regulator